MAQHRLPTTCYSCLEHCGGASSARSRELTSVVGGGGAVIFCQGFGLRDVGRRLEVTPHTLFPIASCTKAFTTLGLAILVDEGKLDWDAPVRRYVPTFALHDPVATERMTPRDLVTHRSGLPRHDLVWYKSACTRRELFDRLRYLEPSRDPRADPRAPGNGQHSVLGCRGAADRGLCAPAQGGEGRSGQGDLLLRRAGRHRTGRRHRVERRRDEPVDPAAPEQGQAGRRPDRVRGP